MSAAGSDTFASATPIAVGDTSAATSNSGLTLEAGEPQPGDGRTAWWSITPTADADLVFSTAGSNVDTILAIYTGSSVGALTQVAYNDDANGTAQSQATLSVTAGTTYHIQVDTYDSAVGSYILAVSAMVYGGGNDRFVDAVDITPGTTSAPVNNGSFTLEPGERRLAYGQGHTAWWKFTAPTDGTVKVDTYYTASPTTMAVYTGGTLATASQVTSNYNTSDPAACTFDVTAGTTYHIQVDNTSGPSATLSVSIAYLGTSQVTIPMSDPDAHFYGHPESYQGGTLPYFQGNVNNGQDYTAIMLAHGSGSTSVHLDQAGFNTAMVAAYASGPYYMSAKGSLSASPNIPANCEAIYVSLTITIASSTADHTFSSGFYLYDASNADVGGLSQVSWSSASPGGSTYTSGRQQVYSSDPTVIEAMRQAINARRMMVETGPRWTPTYTAPTWTDDFSNLAANFSWTTYDRPAPYGVTVTHAPPLRQYPRSDGLGASSARRLWPPSPSVQASNRRVGGYL